MAAAKIEVKICECCGQTIAKTARLSAKRHADTIDKLYDFELDQLKVKRGSTLLTRARNHLWFLLVIEDNWSLQRAGDKTGHGHHAVLSGVRLTALELNLPVSEKASMNEIRLAYWIALGLSKKEAEERVFDY